MPCKSTAGGDTIEWAKALPQDTASMRDHRRIQGRFAERLRIGGASRARAEAKVFTKSTDSVLHRPPVSMATTTKWHLSPWRSSAYFLSLSASQSDVHSELSSMAERETGRQHCGCHCDIHVAELGVEPHRGPCFPANSRQSFLWWHGSSLQPA